MDEASENPNRVGVAIRLATVSDADLLARFRYEFRSSVGPLRENSLHKNSVNETTWRDNSSQDNSAREDLVSEESIRKNAIRDDSVSETEEGFVLRCSSWMQERLRADSSWKCWIAERDQMPVGHLWLQIIDKIPNPTIEREHHAYITNFYIREDARGRGIGSILMSEALEWIRTHDVDAVILWPTDRSRSLYERHGFAVRQDLMELIVGSDRDGYS